MCCANLIVYIDEYIMCRCTLINIPNFVSVLFCLPHSNFAYTDKYICTCMLIKVKDLRCAKFFKDEQYACR